MAIIISSPCSGGGGALLEAITNFTAVENTVIETGLTWDNPTDEVYFLLEYSDDAEVTWNFLAFLPENTVAYTHMGLTSSTHYYYRIRSIDQDGGTSAWATGDILLSTPAFPVTNLSADFIGDEYDDVAGTWTDNLGNGYQWTVSGGSSTKPPKYSLGFNGHDAIDCIRVSSSVGGALRMALGPDIGATGDDAVIAIVFEKTVNNTDATQLLTTNNANPGTGTTSFVISSIFTSPRLGVSRNNGTSDSVDIINPLVVGDEVVLVVRLLNNGAADDTVECYYNSRAITTSDILNPGAMAYTMREYTLGKGSTNFSHSDLRVARVMLYQGTLTNTEIDDLILYLSATYGVTVAGP